MKKLTLILTIVLCLCATPALASHFHVLIYCDFREPGVVGELKEHWKPEIPALGPMVITNFMIVAKEGSKRVFHCLIQSDSHWQPVKNYIDNHPELGILYWWGRTTKQVYTNLWQDNKAIAKRVLLYEVPEVGTVTAYDAETIYGETIDPSKLLPAMGFCLME